MNYKREPEPGDLDYGFDNLLALVTDRSPRSAGFRGELAGEVSRRKYPKALRPQVVFNGAGGWMTWEQWLAHPTITSCAGLLFEDGASVGSR